VDVVSGSVTRTFTIYNLGTGDLTLIGDPTVMLTGDTDDFVVVQQPESFVQAGGRVVFQVQFDPSSEGLKTATVSVANDDSDENPYDSVIQGTGLKDIEGSFHDDFEDGAIDIDLWVVGGGARGYSADDPIGTGDWQYSHEEISEPADGYLRARVWGPTSAMTYGAEAWIRTTYDFNDGNDYLLNFTWEPDFGDSHGNLYFLQITDGFVPPVGDLHWPQRYPPNPPITEADLAGTTDLLWQSDDVRGWAFENSPSPGKLSQSIAIDSSGTVSLYSAPDAGGSLVYESTLSTAHPWYVRFMVSDGTSGGFPAGDAQLNLYSLNATVEGTVPPHIPCDMNWDGIVSIVGDVPPFVQVVYFGDFAGYEQQYPGKDPVVVGDCNGDGILSIVGDVPGFVNHVYFGQALGEVALSAGTLTDSLQSPVPIGESQTQEQVVPNLPGLELVDPDPGNLQGQIIYLDCDGAEDVVYDGPVTVGPFDVPAFQAPGELAGQEQAIIDQLLANLQDIFADSGVIFTIMEPGGAELYSTMYVGGDDCRFAAYGSFLGLAEHVDVGNRDRDDDGFVFAQNVATSTLAEDCASSLACLIAHEAGHLLGYEHDSTSTLHLPLSDVAAATAAEISSYIDTLSVQYKVPAVIIKSLVQQESRWYINANNPEGDGEGVGLEGMGLTQITLNLDDGVLQEHPLGYIDLSGSEGSNPFITDTEMVEIDCDLLRSDWQYNLEIGVRWLVAMKVYADGAGDDASVVENWYYPLLYYNGAGGLNDPARSFSRSVDVADDWMKSATSSDPRFPYQECVFNIIAQMSPNPTTTSDLGDLTSYFGSPIKVTLPGPSAVGTADGHYQYVKVDFHQGDCITYYSDGSVEVNGEDVGYFPVHVVPFGGPADTMPPTPNPSTWSAEPYATGPYSISMTATAATDPSGVEYYFEETSGNPGGSDSGWRDSAVLLTSNIVKFLTKFSSGSGVKLLQGYMLRAS